MSFRVVLPIGLAVLTVCICLGFHETDAASGTSTEPLTQALQRLEQEIAKLREENRLADIDRNDLRRELKTHVTKNQTFDTGWTSLQAGQTIPATHTLGTLPRGATIWFATNQNGENMTLMDGVYAPKEKSQPNGYGTWLQKVTDKDFEISAGPHAAQSGYGSAIHWDFTTGKTIYVRVVLWK